MNLLFHLTTCISLRSITSIKLSAYLLISESLRKRGSAVIFKHENFLFIAQFNRQILHTLLYLLAFTLWYKQISFYSFPRLRMHRIIERYFVMKEALDAFRLYQIRMARGHHSFLNVSFISLFKYILTIGFFSLILNPFLCF